jgi:hypothetical protein
VLLIFLVLFATSCAPDPRKEAKAQETILIAEQTAQNMRQARQIERERADAARAKAKYQQAVWNANMAEMIQSVKTGIRVIGWSLVVSLSVMVVGFGWTVKETSIGLGQAAVAKAFVSAGLIHMDENTRTFPGFFDVKQFGDTKFVTMLATGQTYKLDEKQLANAALIAALAQVSTAGVLANAAAMNKNVDAAGLAMINPTIVELEGDKR